MNQTKAHAIKTMRSLYHQIDTVNGKLDCLLGELGVKYAGNGEAGPRPGPKAKKVAKQAPPKRRKSRRPPWADDKARAIAMAKAGLSAAQVAKALGRSKQSVYNYFYTLRRAGELGQDEGRCSPVCRGLQQPPWTESQEKAAAMLKGQNWSNEEIGKSIGRTARAVRDHFAYMRKKGIAVPYNR